MVCEIPLANGKGVALVDDADHAELGAFRWYLRKGIASERNVYAVRGFRQAGKVRSVSMHRQLMGCPAGLVDHRNGDGLDNQRSNLRLADAGLNRFNVREARVDSASGAVGVRWNVRAKRWQAEIGKAGRRIYLGIFSDIADAVRARQRGELLHYGEVSPATAAWLAKHDLVLAA